MSSSANENKVISLGAFRELKTAEEQQYAYHAKILAMEKTELLNEMVRFQRERSSKGKLTPEMMIQGKILFTALEKSAETQELQLLTRSYRRHLDFELRAYLDTKKQNA